MLPEDLVTVGGHPPPRSPGRIGRPAAPRREHSEAVRTLHGVLIAAGFGAVLWGLTVAILFASLGG